MTTTLGALRRKFMTPSLDIILFARRGFHTHDPAARDLLEMTSRELLMGFGFGMECSNTDEVVTLLQTLDREFLGFAYEGAVMAFTVRDALPVRRGHRNADFLSAELPATHFYQAYLGIGMTLAFMPKAIWRRALPDVHHLSEHPTLRWMIWDGYGFCQAYFRPEKWIRRQHVSTDYPWPVRYLNRAIDQGIGRALWFYHGAHVDGVVASINSFDPHRRADLWSGAALAAAYAGGAGKAELQRLMEASGAFRAEVFLGGVLASRARILADNVMPYNEVGAAVLCGMPVADASEIAERALLDEELPDGDIPGYEVFRERIRLAAALSPAI